MFQDEAGFGRMYKVWTEQVYNKSNLNLENYSKPYFLQVDQVFANCNNKVILFGQEPNSWDVDIEGYLHSIREDYKLGGV